jgi:hypothetical protein
MGEIFKPVRYGILVGLAAIIFGIGWSFYLVLGHESIHESFNRRAAAVAQKNPSYIHLSEHAEKHREGEMGTHEESHKQNEGESSNVSEGEHQHKGEGHEQTEGIQNNSWNFEPFKYGRQIHRYIKGEASAHEGRTHKEEEPSTMSEEKHQHEEGGHTHPGGGEIKSNFSGGHDNPDMEIAHGRLTRGHAHAMGLGALTIILSFVLAFTSAPDRVKTVVSILIGTGAIIYPLSWIIMGYRIPSLGIERAEESVIPIAGTGALLVFIGIFVTFTFLAKDVFYQKK